MEEFVTYQQAIDLKRLGFNSPVDHVYQDGVLLQGGGGSGEIYPAPSLCQVYDWLISKGLLIVVYSMSFKSWQCKVCERGKQFIYSIHCEDFYFPDEALLEGINECLKIYEKSISNRTSDGDCSRM